MGDCVSVCERRVKHMYGRYICEQMHAILPIDLALSPKVNGLPQWSPKEK